MFSFQAIYDSSIAIGEIGLRSKSDPINTERTAETEAVFVELSIQTDVFENVETFPIGTISRMNCAFFGLLVVVVVVAAIADNVESKYTSDIDDIEAVPPMAMARMMFHSKTSQHSGVVEDRSRGMKEKRSAPIDRNKNRSNSRRNKVVKSKPDKISSRSAFGRYYRFQNAKRTKLSR